MPIRKLLVANRGEIAIRVMRTCREMGIRTVAVYSQADGQALHVKLADEAVPIGEAESALSYLSIGRLMDAARQSGADALHPGYGFLSEREELAEACDAAGIIFVGPSADAMRCIGDKISAKTLAVGASVPIAPGFFEPGAGLEQLEEAAQQIGFPVMLKASAGGGGRGMRVVHAPEEFREAFQIATTEAESAFGDGSMMVEKLIQRPRHVEVQVLADKHGNVACLFERECSIQRRNQKLIEESPSPVFGRSGGIKWEDLRDAAKRLVTAAGYSNAGTVEFMFDEADGCFYFLEVNARLQVEHPVTEAITGLDLVRWQIRIAQGDRLDLAKTLMDGERPAINGHAMEVRIVAEDPARGFMPSMGRIVGWAEPKGPGIRVDTGFGVGSEVTPYYDSMIAKLIAHGANRGETIQRLRSALLDFHVLGVNTNIGYLLDVLDHPDFIAGHIDTGFLGRNFDSWTPPPIPAELGQIAEQATVAKEGAGAVLERSFMPSWQIADGFRN